MAKWLSDRRERVMDDAILRCLAVFRDERDFHKCPFASN
jgi:hypothetical protein